MPERRFPGVVIQGDSLSILFHNALELVKELEGQENEEAFLGALSLAESIDTHLDNYINTMQEHGLELPFPNGKNGSIQSYQKTGTMKTHNKRVLQQPLRGLDGFFVRSSLQNRRKCERYALKGVSIAQGS